MKRKGRGGILIADETHAEDVNAKGKTRKAYLAGFRNLIIRIVILAAFTYLILTYGFLITQCRGQGMFPGIKDGDLCIAFRREAQTLVGERFVKDDVVAYKADGQRRFGRIVAVAGDIVVIDENGDLSVNGITQSQDVPYPTYAREGTEYPLRVPDGCVYILGDYRINVTDSRDLGAIPLESVEGKVITVLRRREI